MNSFNNNPKKYVPQYGGFCAYALTLKGDGISIDGETLEIRGNNLFLFYNSWVTNAKKSWLKESTNELVI